MVKCCEADYRNPFRSDLYLVGEGVDIITVPGTLVVEWLEPWAANLRVVGSNMAHTYRINFFRESPLSHMSLGQSLLYYSAIYCCIVYNFSTSSGD